MILLWHNIQSVLAYSINLQNMCMEREQKICDNISRIAVNKFVIIWIMRKEVFVVAYHPLTGLLQCCTAKSEQFNLR